MQESRPRRRPRDTGAIELGWLTRVVLVLAVVGVAGVDGMSVASTHFAVQDDAAQAAVAGRDSYHDGHNVLTAFLAALQQADQVHPGTRIAAKSFVVNGDGTVTVTVTRTPTTLVAHYLPWLRDHLEQSATAHSLPAT